MVDKVHIRRLIPFKPEDDPPVGAHRHRPIAFEASLKRMESKRRLVEVVDRARFLKGGEINNP
jgi:hypothetical protein